MNASTICTLIALIASPAAGGAIDVDGIRVFGRVHDVSRADIRAAIGDCENDPVAVEVISKTDMRAYWRQRELGWTPMHAYPVYGEPGKIHWGCVGLDITLTPEALRLMRTADAVYVFPVKFTTVASSRIKGVRYLNPHGDRKRSRLLDDRAKRALVRVLGHEKEWFHGHDSRISVEPEPSNVGFLFRRGRDELILFGSTGGRFEGPFNGQLTSGSLEDEEQLEKWKQQFAQPEIARK